MEEQMRLGRPAFALVIFDINRLKEAVCNGIRTAFLDRMHCYVPRWEIPSFDEVNEKFILICSFEPMSLNLMTLPPRQHVSFFVCSEKHASLWLQ